jgi:outer membrane protein OmpA-like peptidoglycan-associated protein
VSTDISLAARAHEENWLPILELAVEEVFEIMVGSRVKPAGPSGARPNGEFTAMVGLAGSLCGVLTVRCDAEAARQIAKAMLGDTADSEQQVADALGEICNMITGNFESGSAQMKSSSQAAFDRIANMLRQRDYRLRIEGHTDNAPIHTAQFPSNWELSTARATEIVRLLIVRDGFSPDGLSAAGFAEYHPVATNSTAEGRALETQAEAERLPIVEEEGADLFDVFGQCGWNQVDPVPDRLTVIVQVQVVVRHETQEAFVSKFLSMLDAISIRLLWSGTDPFGVSLSTSPGSNWAIAEPAPSGEIPALAASAFS